MIRKIVFSVACILSASLAFPQTLILRDANRLEVNGRMQHWRDASDAAPFEKIPEQHFETLNPERSPSFGFDRAVHWFKLVVSNESKQHEWLFEIAYAPLDRIDFYLQPDSDSAWIHKTGGDIFPIASRDLFHRHPIFAFSLQPAKTKVIYLRVQTISSVQLPITIWKRTGFFQASYHVQIINGLFYGSMLVMILYQLFLFLSIRDRITFFYVLTLLSMINIVSFFQGYTFLYLHPEKPELNDFFAMFSGPAYVLFSTLLTRSFLNLRHFSRWLDNLLLLNMSLNLFVAVLMAIFYRQISYEFHHYFILVHCVLELSSAGYCLYRKYRPARYYLTAWITILATTAGFTMGTLGLIPGYLSTNYTGVMIGCIFQMLFISFALGDRWNTLEKENRRSKELELERGQKENERLELEVKLRTTEIQLQNAQLEKANHVKNKLFSVISHDIRGPLNSLHLALSLAKTGSLTSEEFQRISAGLEVRLTQTSEFIDNLLQWAKLQMKAETFEPDRIDLSDLATEAVCLLELECQDKKISLLNNLKRSLYAYADINMMRSVLRNLLTNAIKFTKSDGIITLNGTRKDGRIIISVSDTGVGIPEANHNGLFTLTSVTTPGTRHEKGTGLGLLLCKEFVEKNDGQIWFESEVGKGTVFYFSLPESAKVAFGDGANR